MPSKLTPIELKKYFFAHKIKSILILCIGILVAYYGYTKVFNSNTTTTTYTVGKAEKTTIISTVSGTGQVSTSNQVDLQAKASGRITAINVKTGDFVSAGTLIAKIDTRDAAIALQDAQIALSKLKNQSSNITILQAQNDVNDATEASQKAYNDAFSSMSDSFGNMSDVFNGLDSMLNYRTGYLSDQNTFSIGQNINNSRSKALESFWIAKDSFNKSYAEYKSITRSSDKSTIANTISDTIDSLKLLTTALKEVRNTIDLIKSTKGSNTDTTNTAAATDVTEWSTTINTSLNTMTSSKNSISSTDRNVATKISSLNDTQNSTVPLNIQSAELNLIQKQYAYDDCFIRAPFDGIVAKISVKPTDEVSINGSIGTFITKQKIANISLNEVDIAKVKAGQKVTLTFDAVDELTIAGQVLEVDLIGTISQGVVTYNVKIGFDTDDDRVKSGMSVNASIITDIRHDIIAVPTSAIKTSGSNSYVETLGQNLSDSAIDTPVTTLSSLVNVPVVTGISDDSMIEIVRGLNEGDQIIIKTITDSTKTTASTPNLLSGLSGRAGGNTMRTGGTLGR